MSPGIWHWACCCGGEEATRVALLSYYGQYEVGTYWHTVLSAFPDDWGDMSYTRVTAQPSTVTLTDYDVIWIPWVTFAVASADSTAIRNWLDGSSRRRLVVTSEHTSQPMYATYNTYTQQFLSALGWSVSIDGGNYDDWSSPDFNTSDLMSVNGSHFLTAVMLGLGDAAGGGLTVGENAIGLAWYNTSPSTCGAMCTDDANAQIVLLGDSNIIDPHYMRDQWATSYLNANELFAHRLCTLFAE